MGRLIAFGISIAVYTVSRILAAPAAFAAPAEFVIGRTAEFFDVPQHVRGRELVLLRPGGAYQGWNAS